MTERTIRTRRVAFDHPKGSMRRHYVDGDLVMSHVVALLSATFPPGEDFFVRSVRHYRDRITDPDLAEQVRGFIGQEVVHGREHDRLNRALHEMGYPTRHFSAVVRRDLGLADRFLPPIVRLGFTAGLEHYTATLAEVLLTSPRAQALLGDTEVRSVLLWHALEESEHKAVAFDVFRHVGGSERTRIRTMRWISAGFLLLVITGTLVSLATDRAAYRPGRLLRSIAGLRHSPFLAPEVVRRLRAYNKPGFHPDDLDNTELLERWREELFGTEGALTAKLK
ncbi:metal-dependent hydrolase [Actinomadura montaniterrae]|uniref:Metal-dependent hydrolase n=1 Tax=Actinomadura montaniterrae TaxID=1803903 RepID=A0A6L3VTK8_9ACTN|nr:metal-dependent hydrolase [Actinomadura montaniterrae]KAB2371219.1 metal-dependent hydrolase [Actinomadura montaniterrae]